MELCRTSQEGGSRYVTYQRGYVKTLEAEGFNAAAQKLESMTGKVCVAAQAGG